MDISHHEITEPQRHKREGKPVQISLQELVPEVTSESFERLVLNSSIPVVVDFETAWSKRMVPLLGQLAETFAGRLRVVQVDISADPDLATRFKIRVVPTLLIFHRGIPVEFIVGTVPSRFVFQTVCKTLGFPPNLMQSTVGQRTDAWPAKRHAALTTSSHPSRGTELGKGRGSGTFRPKPHLMKHHEQTNPCQLTGLI
jgi:thioredoxin